MSTPANVLAFWAEAHWGTRYGIIDAAHRKPGHKGLDVGLFHGVVPVPALHSGTVVAIEPNPNVGHYVQVQRVDGMIETYGHIAEPAVSVTQKVKQGANLARQAISKTEGGLQWLGQHTHFALSDTMSGWGTWGVHNFDPTPGVIAVLTNTAGGGGTPIDNAQEGNTVQLVNTPNQGYLLWTDSGLCLVTTQDNADKVNRALGTTGALGDIQYLADLLLGPRYHYNPASGSLVPVPVLVPGGAVDLTPILAAITALDHQADTYQADLTAILAKGLTISGTATPAQ